MSYVAGDPIERGNRRYIAATMDAPYLERDHEMDLARRWRDDQDAPAMHELIAAYGRFVVRIAMGFRGYGLPVGDLIQEGNIGLMQAAGRFDPEREVRFSTYASWWVVAAIQDYILRNASIVRIGTTAAQKSLFFNLRRLRARLADGPDGSMTDADRRAIAGQLSVPLAAVERMEAHITRPDSSLNATIGDGDGDELQDFLADTAPSPEAIVIERRVGESRSLRIADALTRLNERERRIIAGRFLDETPRTLAQLGVVFGVSKERVRQIEARALIKLRAAFEEITDDPTVLLSD